MKTLKMTWLLGTMAFVVLAGCKKQAAQPEAMPSEQQMQSESQPMNPPAGEEMPAPAEQGDR